MCCVTFSFNSRYIEVYVSRKHQMQRHVPYHRQPLTYPKVRKEHESVSEERRWSDTASSDAEGENRESLCILRVL